MWQTSLINDIKHRLLRGEKIEFISKVTNLPEDMIRKAFWLKK